MTSLRSTNGDIDWTALRRRLDETAAAFENAGSPDPQTSRLILERRAARLAQRVVSNETGDVEQVVTFRLGSEMCALNAALVVNVFRLTSLALLPGAPAPVHGVTMWRGEVLTLLDLRGLLGISTAALTDLGRVIVVGRSRAAFGFLADSVHGVRAINRDEVHSLSGQAGGDRRLVTGITSDALLVLDGEEILGLANTGALT